MTTPTNQRLTVTRPDGKTARATVVYLQPKAERWSEQTATVHITCSDWLDPYWHDATYIAGDHSFRGQYLPQTYEFSQPHNDLFKGTFTRAG